MSVMISREHARLTDSTLGQQFAHLNDGRQIAGPHGFHQEDAASACRFNHLLAFAHVEGKGLLAQHGFASLQAEQCILFVERMRRGDVNRVDLWKTRGLDTSMIELRRPL